MSDVDFSAIDRRSKLNSTQSSDKSAELVLALQPQSFFSHRFSMHVEEQETEQRPARPSRGSQIGLERLVDLQLLLMILLIGVPVLLYCVLSSTN